MTLGPHSSSARDIRPETLPVVSDTYGVPVATTTVGREPVPFVLDFGTVAASVRLRARALLVGAIAGAAVGGAILLFVPPRFNARTMILIRSAQIDPMSGVRGSIGPLAELMPGALGGMSDQDLSTELTLLSSRATLGAVVDSLRMQAIPRSPRRIPAVAIIDSMRLVGRFKPVTAKLVAGKNALPQGTVWATQAASVKLLDREDAIDEVQQRLGVRKIAGEAIEIRFRGRDSISAAVVPNLVAATYMARRQTVDRGLNQRRLEFLVAKADSVRTDLRVAADILAATSQRSGVGASPEIGGRALADEASGLQNRLAELRATGSALDTLIAAARSKQMDPRWLAGLPDLLRSPGINDLLSRIAQVETERTVLLARVPATNPQAMALNRARDSLVNQLLPLASSYRSSVGQLTRSLEGDLGRVRGLLSRLPAQAAAVGKDQAEITRLAQLNAGMGMQVLEARLAALAEGGDVRVVDAAVSPRKVTFPRPLPTLAFCIALGLAVGFFYALLGLRRAAVPARIG